MKTKLNSVFLAAGFSLALLAGCTTTGPAIQSHPDSVVAYDRYQTFALLRPTSLPAPKHPAVSPSLIRHLRDDTESAFAAKGLTPVPAKEADLLIVVQGGLEQKLDVTDWGFSYGRFARGYAGTGGRYDLNQYKEGTLLIDVFDAKTRDLVWRGSAVTEVGEMPTEAKLKSAIDAIVARYPN
jgi:hypothetical protein